MATDAADKAHETKVRETADGERLVEHSAFTPGDRELRAVQDEAEAVRFAAQRDAGYIAAPGVGDYHAARRVAKQANAMFVTAGGGGVEDDPSAGVVDTVREAVGEAGKEAAAARRAAERDGRSVRGRRTRSEAMQGTTGGLTPGSGEGAGKSASSTGTDTTDRGMDSTVGSAPANPDPGTENTAQDRPRSQAESKSGGRGTGSTARTTGTGTSK